MPSTMAYRRGDIVLVSFPFAAITSHISDDPDAVLLRRGDFAEGRLPRMSLVKTTKLFTMHSSLVAKRICALRIEKMEEVLRSLRGFFS